jgi:hypothetical protein
MYVSILFSHFLMIILIYINKCIIIIIIINQIAYIALFLFFIYFIYSFLLC